MQAKSQFFLPRVLPEIIREISLDTTVFWVAGSPTTAGAAQSRVRFLGARQTLQVFREPLSRVPLGPRG